MIKRLRASSGKLNVSRSVPWHGNCVRTMDHEIVQVPD